MTERSRRVTLTKPVVAAVIEREGRYLLCQRPPKKHYPLQWEFPGGKVERGETPEAALRREIAEEIGVEINVGPLMERVRHDYGHGHDYELSFFSCQILKGEPVAQPGQGVHRIEWIEATKLAGMNLLAGNRRLAARLAGRSV